MVPFGVKGYKYAGTVKMVRSSCPVFLLRTGVLVRSDVNQSETCFSCIRMSMILLIFHLHYEKGFGHCITVLTEFMLSEGDELFCLLF